ISYGVFSVVTRSPDRSMRHGPEHDVDPHGVGPFLPELVEVPLVLALALPPVTQVGVVADDADHPALVVEEGLVVDVAASGVPGAVGVRVAAAPVVDRGVDRR